MYGVFFFFKDTKRNQGTEWEVPTLCCLWASMCVPLSPNCRLCTFVLSHFVLSSQEITDSYFLPLSVYPRRLNSFAP